MKKTSGWQVAFGLMAVFLFWGACIQMAYATPPDNRPPDKQRNERNVNVEAEASSQATANSESVSGATASSFSEGSTSSSVSQAGDSAATASASNEGVTVGGDTYQSESNNTNVVLVPNNNTSNCMRVFGISFGNGEGAAGLGYPHRDAACDFEQAADDAAATGDHRIAWYWRCQKKNLYKGFEGKTKEEKIKRCFGRMVDMINNPPTPAAVPVGQVLIPEQEYNELLLAQVSQEQVELLEDRYAQQQSLIDELRDDVKDAEVDKAELERLKREAAALKARQEAEEQASAKMKAAASARLALREKEKADE